MELPQHRSQAGSAPERSTATCSPKGRGPTGCDTEGNTSRMDTGVGGWGAAIPGACRSRSCHLSRSEARE